MLQGRKIFITGGAGFIGSTLIGRLVEHNQVVAYDNLSRDSLKDRLFKDHCNLRLVQGDVLDFDHLSRAMAGADIVVHCAAIAGIDTVIRSPITTMRVNIVGSANVLEAASGLACCERVVCFSTSEVFGQKAFRSSESDDTVMGKVGEARWTYGVSKLAEEHLAIAYYQERRLPTSVVRPFNVYGPGQVGEGALRIFIQRALRNEPIEIHGDGTQIRAWCYVEDMVDGVLLAMSHPKAVGESFNIGNQKAVTTIYGLVNTVIRVLDSKSPVLFTRKDYADVELRVPSVSKSKQLLGFEARVDLEEGHLPHGRLLQETCCLIRLTVPSLDADDYAAVQEVLESGYLVQGPKVAAFEHAVASYVGVAHAVAVSNCTAALHLSLLALDIRVGDLVLVTAYSWLATANVIELCGAQPVFVDIRPDTFNLDPENLEQTLGRLMANADTARRVRAILPVHAFGQLADMPAILSIAERYRLPIVEDAACALGASLHGRSAGAWGSLGCFSFHPRKAITTGEGGIITTNDAGLARRLRALRNHGLDPDSATPDFIMPGFNYRLTEFQAALGLTQMAKVERVGTARRRLAAQYADLLESTPIESPVVGPGQRPVYQSYVVQLPAAAAANRPQIIRHLKSMGIETTIGTWHMPLSNYFRTRYGYRPGDFPNTDRVFERSLSLPLYESLEEVQQRHIVRHSAAAMETPTGEADADALQSMVRGEACARAH